MTNYKAKETIKTIWERYARTLKLLDKTLDELDKKPKEVIVEVEKPLPLTLEEVANTNEALRKQLDDLIEWRLRAKIHKAENEKVKEEVEKLKKEIEKLKKIPPMDKHVENQVLDKDYWGRFKIIPTVKAKPSKKIIAQDEYVKNLTKKQSDNKI